MLQTALMCPFPHGHNGLPQKWGVGGILGRMRMSAVRERQLTESGRDLLQHLSAEATRTGVCANHVYILRAAIAESVTSWS